MQIQHGYKNTSWAHGGPGLLQAIQRMTCGSIENAKPFLFLLAPICAVSNCDPAFLYQGGLKNCSEGTESADCISSCQMETAQPYQQGMTGGGVCPTEGEGVRDRQTPSAEMEGDLAYRLHQTWPTQSPKPSVLD